MIRGQRQRQRRRTRRQQPYPRYSEAAVLDRAGGGVGDFDPVLCRENAEVARRSGETEVWTQQGVGEEGAVAEQQEEGEEEEQEVAVVGGAETVVDPGAVVVAFGDADAAEGAVFAAGGFEGLAGAAGRGGVVEDVVVGVCWEMGTDAGGDGAGVRGRSAEVGVVVGEGEEEGDGEALVDGEVGPGGVDEEGGGAGEEAEEDYLGVLEER